MRTLHLLRHAKSDWSDPSLRDFDRPLSKRGRKAAPRIATEMHELGIKPDLVISSSSLRTRQTWDLVRPLLFPDGHAGPEEVRFSRALYLAAPEQLLEIAKNVDSRITSLMLIGHNPGMENLADILAGSRSDEPSLQMLQEKFPTAALACFEFDIEDWSELAPGTGKLVRFLTPRSLD